MRNIFSKDYEFVLGNALAETALSDANYPVSGSYIDVSGYEWVNVVIHLGTLADAVTFTMKQTDSTAGTLDTISTANCVHTVATDDDGEMISFYIETQTLAKDHHFLSCAVGANSGSNYADITYILGGARHQPITQTTAVLPAASQNIHAG